MERTTVRLPAGQLRRIERRVEAGEFPDRSAAIRAAVRQRFGDEAAADGGHDADHDADRLAAAVETLASVEFARLAAERRHATTPDEALAGESTPTLASVRGDVDDAATTLGFETPYGDEEPPVSADARYRGGDGR